MGGLKKPVKRKSSTAAKPPPIDVWAKPAIAVGLALLAYQFFKGLKPEIPRINVLDDTEMREIFFGEGDTGNSYAVLCHPEESTYPISSVFQEAYADGSSPALFRIVDCDYVLPASEKSIADRFKLDTKTRPTIFITGAVGPPQQVPAKHLKTGNMLVKVLRGKLEPRAAKIETTQDLRTKCLDKDICALLLKGTKTAPQYLKDAMSKLLVEFPKVSFAAVDASVLYALNLEEHLPELENDQPRFVVFKKVSGSLEAGKDRLVTSIAPLKVNGVSYGQMSNLVGNVVSGKVTADKIPSLPVIKSRTKKLVAEEKAKRERKRNQEQRSQQNQQQKNSYSGAFHDNDGSREGRKAERERRRAEHNKEHNIKPKTPEEIAEMERQRRIRMEEQSANWNVAPEDLPDEGEPVEDDGEGFIMEDGDETTTIEDMDETSDGEDDDVIDLD